MSGDTDATRGWGCFLEKGLFCHFLTKWECIFRMGQNLIEFGGRGLTLMSDLCILIVKICARHKWVNIVKKEESNEVLLGLGWKIHWI